MKKKQSLTIILVAILVQFGIFKTTFAQSEKVAQVSTQGNKPLNSFKGKATISKNEDNLTLKSTNGASFTSRSTSDYYTISGKDEKGRSFSLKLSGDGDKVKGQLIIGTRVFSAEGTASKVVEDLDNLALIKAVNDIPSSKAINSLALDTKNDQNTLVKILGNPVYLNGTNSGATAMVNNSNQPHRDSYCQAVCKACGKGGPLSPWYCISCGSCDFFGVDRTVQPTVFIPPSPIKGIKKPNGN